MKSPKTKSNRLKLTLSHALVPQTRADLESLVREIAELTLARNKQQTELDQAITTLRARYEENFAVVDQMLTTKTEAARAWAEANPAEFKGLKSLDLTHGTIGFRASTKVKILAGWTIDKVLSVLKASYAFSYVRAKEELNKEALIADRALLDPDALRRSGLRIVQDESFFIDPKIDQPENRQTTKQAA